MYTFAVQNQKGKAVEEAFTVLLDAANIPWAYNPYTGTDDPRRADYDVSVGNILVEVKGNPMAATTGNVAIEEDILETSKADYFLIAFPVPDGWHGRMLHRLEIDKLLRASKMNWNGRTYKYKRVEAGQYHRPSALIPTSDLIGIPVSEFIINLKV